MDWTLFDFAAAAMLLLGAGLAFFLISRRVTGNRIIVGLAVMAALAFIWVELAVGLVGSPLAGS